ncbi:ATP-dependent RNA helicase ddx23 isoform X1 [Zeugodacus cucurbitae]|uniref:ATP-dependent RNA helicase ddx23 isoform X1 n=1 Tax=Zeugodacus cucurbitae TaxID=28588 RepID=UPI0023D90882|nr:ATP-dependent RNA helicase ddx23 isoform X1 [Zeugodacus cucurbitae]
MKQLNLVLWLALLLHQEWLTLTSAAQQQQTTSNAQSSVVQLYDSNRGENAAAAPAESVLGSIYRKSRQSRCVRCYEDRYGDDRSRYYGTSGYSSHSADNWYYPYDRYDDRYRSEDRYRTEDRYRPDYDRYSSSSSMASSYYRDRDDRLGSRTYDRYDTRGYDRYDRRGGYEQDRYGDYSRDRYYERPRGGASYDRDYYDRSTSSRYDYRNYRPYDETYRGQSGFDNSGRGYYFAGEDNDRQRYPSSKSGYDQRASSSPCGVRVTDCPYASRGGSGGSVGGGTTQVTSRPITSQHGYDYGYSYGVGSSGNAGSSGNSNGSGSGAGAATRNTSANNSNNSSSSQGWSYVDERDKASSVRGNGRDENRGRERERERDRDPQSSAYGSRPPRPLGGSYLFDRDSNTVGDEKMADNAADKDTSGGNADGVSNISSSSMTGEQNRDMNNGGANGNDGGMANSMQTNVRDKQ